MLRLLFSYQRYCRLLFSYQRYCDKVTLFLPKILCQDYFFITLTKHTVSRLLFPYQILSEGGCQKHPGAPRFSKQANAPSDRSKLGHFCWVNVNVLMTFDPTRWSRFQDHDLTRLSRLLLSHWSKMDKFTWLMS